MRLRLNTYLIEVLSPILLAFGLKLDHWVLQNPKLLTRSSNSLLILILFFLYFLSSSVFSISHISFHPFSSFSLIIALNLLSLSSRRFPNTAFSNSPDLSFSTNVLFPFSRSPSFPPSLHFPLRFSLLPLSSSSSLSREYTCTIE